LAIYGGFFEIALPGVQQHQMDREKAQPVTILNPGLSI
jgi:hypothetical protein